jgi:hypothetical protein
MRYCICRPGQIYGRGSHGECGLTSNVLVYACARECMPCRHVAATHGTLVMAQDATRYRQRDPGRHLGKQ